jgi:hypothetical protein
MKTNVFEKHGVAKLSPSSINKFRANPAKWLVNIAGYRDKVYAPAMTFGNIVELGITHCCLKPNADIEEAIHMCMDRYDVVHKEIMDAGIWKDYDSDGCFKRQQMIPEILRMAVPIYRSFGNLEQAQHEVEYKFDDMPIPIRGFIDMEYSDTIRDLKTTGTAVKTRSDHLRQVSFYSLATGKKAKLDYVYATKYKKELITKTVHDVETHIKDIHRIAKKMMQMLSFSSDIHEVARMSCLEPDTTNENFMNQWGPTEIKGAQILFKE